MKLEDSVSVVIPCYNCASTLESAVNSALENRRFLRKIILVDNASADNTWLECLRMKEAHGDLISILSEPRPGACQARNTGLKDVESEWVQFLDADDRILANKFEQQVQFANAGQFDVVVSPFFKIDTAGTKTKSAFPELPAAMGLMRGKMGTTGANLFRTSTVKAIGGWNPRWSSAQEYELMFRLLQNGALFGALDKFYLEYSVGVEGSISNGDPIDLRTNSLKLRREMLEVFLEQDWSEKEVQRLSNGLFLQIRWALFYNPALARENWQYLQNRGYTPSMDTNLPLVYCFLVNWIGLTATEKLRLWYQKFTF